MRMVAFLATAGVGFALMLWSYFSYSRVDQAVPWCNGLMFLAAPQEPLSPPAEPATEYPPLVARVRQLPLDTLSAEISRAMSTTHADRGSTLSAQLSEKLIALAPDEAGLGEPLLLSGRLPVAGADEVLAGAQAACHESFTVAGRELKVVGVLRREVALFAHGYLIPPHEGLRALLDGQDPAVGIAVLVRLSGEESRDRQFRRGLAAAYPRERFTPVGPMLRVDRGPYYLYLAGQALVLFGGSGVFIALYAGLAGAIRWPVLQSPLAALAQHCRLLRGLHLAYFGLVILVALPTYELPALQLGILAPLREQLSDGHSVLGVVGKAYGGGNIALAAAITLAVNFLLGTLLYITLPSLVVPGVGVLLAALRAVVWGLLMAPTFVGSAWMMLPHSWTLLVEGEGYILAAFFAALVPVYLCQPSRGGFFHRYGGALMLNLEALLLIGIVLLAAACYEATEVILMAR